jgi:thiamine-phosphate pyrophosphorylase
VRIPPSGLVAITPGDHQRRRDLLPWLAALGAAGLRTVLLREPHLDDEALRAVTQAARNAVPEVIVHARCRGALALADALGLGLHLPGDGDPKAVREAVSGPLGVSCHTSTEVEAALSAGADYTLLSPVWHPTSKPGDTRIPLGQEAFLAVAAGRPVLALGGVTPERYRALLDQGAQGAAVLGALFGVSDPKAAARRVDAFLGQKTKMSSS